METRFIILLLVYCLAGYNSYAQTSKMGDNQNLVNEYALKYIGIAGDHAVIFNGKDQPKLINNAKSGYLRKKGDIDIDEWGSETFNIDSPTNGVFDEGKLFYDGVMYLKLPMRLDLYTDELMVLTPNITHRIILHPDRVGYAEFNGYRVEYINAGPEAKIPKGYYAYLYSGKCAALKKETFSFRRETSSLFNWSRKYYIYKDGIYYQVKNKRTILNVFKSHKKELDKYIKDMNMDFKNMELVLPMIVEQYEKLVEKQ